MPPAAAIQGLAGPSAILPSLFVIPDVVLPRERVGGRAGHHHLHRARVVAVTVPVGTQRADRFVHVDANPPRHADDHGLAFDRIKPLLEGKRIIKRVAVPDRLVNLVVG